MDGERKILIVDDDESNREIIEEYLKLGPNAGYQFIHCENGKIGLEKLIEYAEKVDVVLLDRMMPVMSGVEFLKEWGKDEKLKNIPVIMQTASNESEHLTEGFQLGVYHYLVKPYMPAVLNSVVKAAIDFYTMQRELSSAVSNSEGLFRYVDKATFKIRTINDAQSISVGLAQLFPNPNKVVVGISEILINSIEHGNLGITYDKKTDLNMQCQWKEEVERRLNLEENLEKMVIITYEKMKDKIILKMRDQGKGFNYEQYLEFDPRRSTDNHGRGIAFAQSLSFDEIQYVGNGNEVNCTVFLNEKAEIDANAYLKH